MRPQGRACGHPPLPSPVEGFQRTIEDSSIVPRSQVLTLTIMSEIELLRITRTGWIECLRKVEDVGLQTHMDSLLEPGREAWWGSLPPKMRASVRKGIDQANKGGFVPEEEVRKVQAQWRNR